MPRTERTIIPQTSSPTAAAALQIGRMGLPLVTRNGTAAIVDLALFRPLL
jgi:hypothetical protein